MPAAKKKKTPPPPAKKPVPPKGKGRTPKARRPGTGRGGKKGQRRRRYTDADRIAFLTLLDANGGNLLRTAEQTDVPYMTLQQWASGSRHPEARVIQVRHKGDLTAAARDALWQVLDGVTDPEKIRKANLAQAASAADKLFGMMRTLEGQPAGITAGVHVNANFDFSALTPDELLAYLALAGKLRPAAAGRTSGPVGIGAKVLPPLREAVVPDPGTGAGDDPGPGYGRDGGTPTGGAGRADTAAVDPDAAGYAQEREPDGLLSGVGVG